MVSHRCAIWSLAAFIIASPFYNWTLTYVLGLPLGRIDLLAIFVLLITILMVILIRKEFHLLKLNLLTILLTGVATLSSLFATTQATGTTAPIGTMLIQFAVIFVLLITIPVLVRTTTDIIVLIRVWLLSAAAIGGFAVYQGIARTFSLPLSIITFNVPEPGTVQRVGYTDTFGPFFRVASVFPEPSWLGAYLAPPTVFCLLLLTNHPNKVVFKNKKTTFMCGALLISGIAVSASLLAYLTLLISVLLFVFPVGIYRGKLNTPHLYILFPVILLVFIIIPSVREGIRRVLIVVKGSILLIFSGDLNITTGSVQKRFDITKTAIETWAGGTPIRLFIGNGLNSLERNTDVVYSSAFSYGQMLADTGIVGLGLFIFIILGTGITTYRISLSSDSSEVYQTLGIAFTGAIITMSIQLSQVGYLIPVRWISVIGALCYIRVYSNKLSYDIN